VRGTEGRREPSVIEWHEQFKERPEIMEIQKEAIVWKRGIPMKKLKVCGILSFLDKTKQPTGRIMWKYINIKFACYVEYMLQLKKEKNQWVL
jgi:hypothetical protein